MPGLTSQQKAAVTQFVNFTQTDKKVAERVLRTHNWNLQQAVDGFFIGNSNSQSTAMSDRNSSALSKLFDKYRGKPPPLPSPTSEPPAKRRRLSGRETDSPQDNPDLISIDGTMTYLSDLQLSIDSIAVLVLSELVASPTLGEITRAGFLAGWAPHGATTLPAQRTALASLASPAALNTPSARAQGGLFRRVYKHTFKLACPTGSKSVPLDMACEYWKLLLGPQGVDWNAAAAHPWLDWWLGFLTERWKKAVNRDLWEQTVVFEEMTRQDPGLGWWSEDGAWPGVIDEFVEWCRKVKGVGGGTDAGAGAMELE